MTRTQGSGRRLRTRLSGGVLAAQLVVGGLVVVAGFGVAPAPASAAVGEAKFQAITPCRIVDTRAAGTGGGFAAGQQRSFTVAGATSYASQGGSSSSCGIPADAVAIEATVTTTKPVGGGFLRAWPAGASAPNATFLNFSKGVPISNTGTIALATSGSADDVTVRVFGSATPVVIDVQGYFAPTTTTAYTSLTPCRIVDTRATGSGGGFSAGQARTFRVAGSGSYASQGGSASGCGIPADAVAVEATVTTTKPAGGGYLRSWPADDEPPTATFLNFTANVPISNTGTLAIAPTSAGTDLTVRVLGSATPVVIDVQGYYSATGGLAYNSLTPCRIIDTRAAGSGGGFAASQQRTFRVAGSGSYAAQGGAAGGCGIPSTAVAVEATVTATLPAGGGFLRAWPAGASAPNATFLNYSTGIPISNTGTIAIASTGSADDLTVRAFGSATPVVVDVQGYFAPATPPPAPPAALNVGGSTACAVVGGAVKCWGFNGFGGLGNGTDDESAVPVPVTGISNATTVGPGGQHGCALIAGGEGRCWGRGGDGQLGSGTTVSLTPMAVTGLSGATQIEGGGLHTCARLSSGTVKCWGSNGVGQLGNGGGSGGPTPVTVSGISDATAIAVGAVHSCAIVTGGAVKCWGSNAGGQLGDGTTTNRPSPVTVSGLTGATSIGAGAAFTCASLNTGAVRCWGRNDQAQLGNGDATLADSKVPVTVTGVTGAAQVTAGDGHACARTGTTAKCWGYNLSGEIGNGSTERRQVTPVTVALSGITFIDAGGVSTCATTASSGTYCWGNGIHGGLGNGAYEDSPLPVRVSGL